ncbi:MAG: response regulator [Candidatus Hydrothermarchaeaceae archaeon]
MTKVMVVDDDPDVILILKRVLSRHGYDVTGARGNECLKKVSEERPDIIFLDVMMRGMSGWEVCKKIKKDSSTSSIPVSMLTVRKSEKDIKKSLDSGADKHLGKPINFKEILMTIRDLLEFDKLDAEKVIEGGCAGG